LLELSRVTQWFEKGCLVLSEVDLSLEAGQLVALLGPSGSGKSSLLNLIGALEKPKGGSIRFEGLDIAALGVRQIADYRAACVGFVFQEHHLLPQLSALENALVPTMARPWSRKETPVEAAMRLLEAVGVADRKHALPSEMSGGERQRVALARSLINSP
jgi:ABC-type lipoprotein export system ATPase subunit